MNARGLIYFKTLIYWSTRATGPTILATVGIIVRRVTSTFLVLLRFLCKPLVELSNLFGQMAYLIGIPTAWFLPGLLRGIERLSQPVLLAAVLVEPTTLRGVVSRERSVNSLAPLAKLVGTALLGVPFVGSFPMRTLPLYGYVVTDLAAAATLALLARAASFDLSANTFSRFLRSNSMALGDSGTIV